MRTSILLSIFAGISTISSVALLASASPSDSHKLFRRERPVESDIFFSPSDATNIVMELKPNTTQVNAIKNVTEIMNFKLNDTNIVAITNSTDPTTREKVTKWLNKHATSAKFKDYLAEHVPLVGAVAATSMGSVMLSTFLTSPAVALPALTVVGIATGTSVLVIDILNHLGTSVIKKFRSKPKSKDHDGHDHDHDHDEQETAAAAVSATASTIGCCPGCTCAVALGASQRPTRPTLSRTSSSSSLASHDSHAGHNHAGHDHSGHHHHH
ncbi:hypothetical protein BDF19DRAFT_464364 [Syncephalis fuscata]|nr:hypothetical protein BDF19DRAFT_464364 [Syncephalis fuscata]